MTRLIILGCVKTKRTEGGLLPARERYCSSLWHMRLGYFERQCSKYPEATIEAAVLSAKYGVIGLDAPIPYYETPLTGPRVGSLAPMVHDQLLARKPGGWSGWTLEVHGGKEYARVVRLVARLVGGHFLWPLEGMALGYQRRWYQHVYV